MFHLKYLHSDEFWQMQSKHLTDPFFKLYKTLVIYELINYKNVNFPGHLKVWDVLFSRNYN